jgi:unsaturated rhamnogalacturonyl hydrolase
MTESRASVGSLLALTTAALLSAGAASAQLINAGGPAVPPYAADMDFAGGFVITHANAIDLSGVTSPAPAAVYQTARAGNCSYTIPGFAAGSSHVVRLHFAETYWTAAGKRVFGVSINGAAVLSQFDIFVAAGNKNNKAVIEAFTMSASATGQYVIQLTSVTDNAMVSGVEVQGTTATATPTMSTSTSTPSPTATAVTSGNLALGKPVTVSSTENAGTAGKNAVDGNTGTRWASAFSDPQWIAVDLGATTPVARVRLVWEAAYGKNFELQVSNDAAAWTSIKSVTGGTGGTQDFTGLASSGRYVRMYGTVRATGYGYSLWEFEIYSTGGSATPTATPRATPRPTATLPPPPGQLPPKADVLATIRLVNDHWIASHNPVASDQSWGAATYHRGNVAVYEATGDAKYHDLAVNWATAKGWALLGGDTTRNADNQAAGEVYSKLYLMEPDPARITHIDASIHAMVLGTASGDWSWVDAINMSMPSFAYLGSIKNDPAYWSRMFDFFDHTQNVTGGPGLYDKTDHLWFRDGGFLPPHVGPNGKKEFWSRGNGWAFAALTKTLMVLPITDAHRPQYVQTYQDMAAALAAIQRSDGFWNVDLGDPLDFPGPETSGTSFFTFGIAWGIESGVLDRATYFPVVARAWNGLATTAVQPSGVLGYCQAAGASPSAGQPVTATSTNDFGVGAFLLAGNEAANLAP